MEPHFRIQKWLEDNRIMREEVALKAGVSRNMVDNWLRGACPSRWPAYAKVLEGLRRVGCPYEYRRDMIA